MRVQDYSLPKEIPTEAKEMLDDIRRVLNNGGYVPQVLPGVPNWYGETGESVVTAVDAQQRLYYYNYNNNSWDYGLPLSTKYGWTYISVTNAESSKAVALGFGFTFSLAPIVHVSYLGYSVAAPSSPADFTNAVSKVSVASYAPTTTGCNIAVYTGDGTNFAGNYNIGVGWIAIG